MSLVKRINKSEGHLQSDLDKIIKKAMEKPGIADLVRVYGQYESMTEIVKAYLNMVNTPVSFSVTDSTSE